MFYLTRILEGVANNALSLSTETPPPTWGNPGATSRLYFTFFLMSPQIPYPRDLNYTWLRGEHCLHNMSIHKKQIGTHMTKKVDWYSYKTKKSGMVWEKNKITKRKGHTCTCR